MTSLETINTPTIQGMHKPEGYTALHFACDGSDRTLQHAKIVEDLIEQEADIEAQTKNGKTAFLLAAGTGLGSHVEVLLNGGCNKFAQGQKDRKGASREDGRVGQFELTANIWVGLGWPWDLAAAFAVPLAGCLHVHLLARAHAGYVWDPKPASKKAGKAHVQAPQQASKQAGKQACTCKQASMHVQASTHASKGAWCAWCAWGVPGAPGTPGVPGTQAYVHT